MRDVSLTYTTEIYNNFRPLYANWEPSTPVQLGHYGELRGRLFIHRGHVGDFNISFKDIKSDKKDQKIFSSKGSTKVQFTSKGSAPVEGVNARAKLAVTFSSDEAVFFNAAECSFSMIKDKQALGQAVLGLYDKGRWDRRWVIITDLITAGSTTIAVSGGHSASVEFEATSDVSTINLADASVGLAVTTSTNVGYQVVAAQGLVPLFGLCKVQRSFWPWGQPGFEPAAAAVRNDPSLLDQLQGPEEAKGKRPPVFFAQLTG